jgi:hypothetical protein
MAFLTQPGFAAARHPIFSGGALLLALSALLLAPRAFSQNRHYQLKAAFLVNFAEYVEWPSPSFTDKGPFVFGVLGENPFNGSLKSLVADELVQGRRAVVEHYKSVSEIGPCHILFISDSERSRLPAIMTALADRSILTVSDLEGFGDSGGVIRFVTETRVRFRINTAAARRARLTISSKLLRLADAVETTGAK